MHEAATMSVHEYAAVTDLLYREALCLDEARLDDWMGLYSEEGVYWMPAHPNQICPDTEISILYENKLLMDIRRRNFGHSLAPSMEYPIRGSRILGNIHLTENQPDNGFVRVTSSFHAQLYYREEFMHFAGKYTHDLVRDGESFTSIAQKRVDLINADGVQRNLLIYV